jgi:hypothetical protein
MYLEIEDLQQRVNSLEKKWPDFLRDINHFGLEWFRKYYGLYRAIIKSNEDPEKRGRVQILCAEAGHKDEVYPRDWVDPILPTAGPSRGSFVAPQVGDWIWVTFAQGNPAWPVGYIGSYFGGKEMPPEFAYTNKKPETQGIITRGGHTLVMSDTPGEEKVTLSWHQPDAWPTNPQETPDRTKGKSSSMVFKPDGSIETTSSDKAKITLDSPNQVITVADSNGNTVTLDKNGITVKDKSGNNIKIIGGDVTVQMSGDFNVTDGNNSNLKTQNVNLGLSPTYSAVLGELFMTLFNAHVHPHPLGPTAITPTQMTPAALSSTVKLSK